ncbi:disco-interacting protein 2 homolog A-like isoform X2 [Montipora capricornis]|uniref:disco-interacting protein 2 homolog A-like isoform X2 n=1 Tax=Montipora capricornis TaxID=246305 RepID=UPI0035F1939D
MAKYKPLLLPRNVHFPEPLLHFRPTSMTEPLESSLPPPILEKLRELNTELAEGDITQKGYEKKRAKLLGPYLSRDSYVASPNSPNMNDHFSAVQRSEALQAALAKRLTTQDPDMPAPFKRQSLMKRKPMENGSTQLQLQGGSISSQDSIGNFPPSDYTPPGSIGSRNSIVRVGSEEFPLPPPDSSMIFQNRYSSGSFPVVTPPPDLTRQTPIPGDPTGSRVMHMSSVRTVEAEDEEASVTSSRVSSKIQQLLNTLKRPKRKPLEQFYTENDDELVEATKPDPNAPHPEGQTLRPVIGESLEVSEELPKNLEESVSRFASKSPKVSCFSVVDSHGKTSITLTYGKLLSRSMKLAYALLNKVGSHKEGTSIMTGDRVALVYQVDDPINFMTSFYGCLIAGIIPVPIEPPASKDYPGCQQIGFLLGSCGVSWALTSDACLKTLPKDDTGHVCTFKGWPKLQWFVTANLNRHPKDWQPPSNLDRSSPAYIESTVGKDGAVMGVTVTRMSMNLHTQVLSQACSYTEGEIMISVLDPKREVGLWHSVLTSVMNGMHVIYVPPSVLKNFPAMWLQVVTKHRATCALVSSRDLHWSLHASKDVKDINLTTIRMLLLADRANPWSLSACDSFLSAFEAKGLKPEALCPCASSTETMTISLRRPGKPGTTATGRGVLSLSGLSHGVVRVDKEGSLTSLTLQDCGIVLPGAKIGVVRVDGPPYLCKSDEVGELCISSGATGSAYWGLAGKTNYTFKLQPTLDDGAPFEQYPLSDFVRTGLLGFLGPGGLVFVCGTADGIIKVSGRRHNCDDLKATILAVDPIKFVYRGRIAIFSTTVLKDDRIVVVAEQRPQCTEEESFQWMSHVLPAVDSIHNVGIYCLCLVAPGGLPKTSSGAVHIHETRQKFMDGSLHPANILMCPHTCVTNLPQPRQKHPEPGPAATMVGNIVMGTRIGGAAGREIADIEEDSDMARKYQFLAEILKWRAQTMPDHTLFTLLNAKGTVASLLTTSQLHKRAERVAQMAVEQGRLSSGDNVALVFTPGVDFIVAVFACLYAGLIPVPIRPPHANNISTTLPTVKMVIDVSKSRAVLTTHNIAKALRSKEAVGVVDIKSWPTVVEIDDAPKRKLVNPYRAPTPEMIAYLDFSVSTTGLLSGVKMSHSAVTGLCRSMKLACELYPSRDIAVCLDPYCGLGFLLWCLTGVYSGHHTILIPPGDLETNPALWLSVVSQYKVRDTFCSYPVMDLCTKGLGQSIPALKAKGVNLTCVRNCVVVAEERPRINLTTAFSTLFSGLGLSPRAVSTSFGSRANVAICTQGASTPEASSVYVDTRALRNDRVTLVERGSPNSLCLLESGKILPGVKVVIANPETKGMCADSHLGEIWVSSPHNGSGYFATGEDTQSEDRFNAKLTTGPSGDMGVQYARTGYLGFIKRTDFTQTDGARHDALFVVGPLDETMMLRGMRYHPVDIENSVTRCHRSICESAVFTWTNLLVVVVELDAEESEALDVVPLVTSSVLDEQHLIVGVVVVVDPGVVPINSRGEKQRMHLRDGFLADQLDPIYVAYNM